MTLPIAGAPAASLESAAAGRTVALLGADYVGVKPRMQVEIGASVLRGQPLFEDRRDRDVRFTAPAQGRIVAIHRGPRRAFESIVIEMSQAEQRGDGGEQVELPAYCREHPSKLDRRATIALLLESGDWTALRQRPFSTVARPMDEPRSVFVTAIDTQPLAPDVDVLLRGRDEDLERGLHVVANLTRGPVFVCVDAHTRLDLPDDPRFRLERFDGPHPAGTVGLHIHRLDPVDRTRKVWHLGLQDLLAIGALFGTGRIDPGRTVALGGPAASRPRLLRTRIGAETRALCEGELRPGDVRLLSGSVLSGRRACGEVHGYLGRYHQQLSAIFEERTREFLGWLAPGRGKFSITRTFVSRWLRRASFELGTSTGGSARPIVPLGLYERVLPMDLEPAFLLKALMMRDAQWAEKMGCLELDEEDVALCAFVCSGKSDFGRHLRDVLTDLQREGM